MIRFACPRCGTQLSAPRMRRASEYMSMRAATHSAASTWKVATSASQREVQRHRGRSAASGNTDAQTNSRQTPGGPGVHASNRDESTRCHRNQELPQGDRRRNCGSLHGRVSVRLLRGVGSFLDVPARADALPQGVKGAVDKAAGKPKDDMTFQELEDRLNAAGFRVNRTASDQGQTKNAMWFGENFDADVGGGFSLSRYIQVTEDIQRNDLGRPKQ